MEQIKIISKLRLNDYLKMIFRISISRYIILGSIGILCMFISALLFIHSMSHPNPSSDNSTYYFLFLYGLILIVWLPIKSYFSSKKVFSTNKRIQEETTYEFSEIEIKSTGESFKSQYDWNKIFKIRKVNNLLLLYQDKMVANIINLDKVSQNDYDRLKDLILSKKLNVKVKL